jgi:NADH-quinone oxidoreductase subunit L
MGAVAALCTAFYMVRLLMLTFYGKFRGDHHTEEHLHETSPVMWAPLCVLAVLSALVGYLNVPEALPFPHHFLFEHYLDPVIAIPAQAAEHWTRLHAHYAHSTEYLIMGVSVLGMALASGLAIQMYKNGFSPLAHGLKERFSGLHALLSDKWRIDELYDAVIVTPVKDMSLFLWKVVDTKIIDGIVNGVGQACMLIGGLLSFRMSGSLHRHGMVLMAGLVCLLTALLL